jgi:carboxyl-terminal processing protease
MLKNPRALGMGAAIMIASCAITAFTVSARYQSANEALFRDVLSVVNQRYIDQMPGDSLLKHAALGLVDQLNDPYARLYSPAELAEFTSTNLGHYGGIGLSLEERDGLTVVVQVFPNTPAERAGFQDGDVLTAVDGDSTRGWPLEKTTGRLRGPIGSKVRVTFRNEDDSKPHVVDLERAQVRVPAVPYETLIGSVGYIPINSFAETTSSEVSAAVKRLQQQGAKSFLLDLRGNGGGVVEQAVRTVDIFVKGDLLVATQKERGDVTTYRTDDAGDLRPLPVIVMVDEGTASASEIVAAALQDHGRAAVVGAPTFGKGIVQSTFRVAGGHVLKLTTGEWLTPSGKSLHRRRTPGGRGIERDSAGVHPDVVVRNDTFTSGERALVEALRPHGREFYLAYSGLAKEQKEAITDAKRVSPALLDELYQRLQERGVKISRDVFDAGASYTDFLMRSRAATYRWGNARAKLETMDRDKQMQRALDLLKENATDSKLMAAVHQKREG